jgi:hypothetical protein
MKAHLPAELMAKVREYEPLKRDDGDEKINPVMLYYSEVLKYLTSM